MMNFRSFFTGLTVSALTLLGSANASARDDYRNNHRNDAALYSASHQPGNHYYQNNHRRDNRFWRDDYEEYYPPQQTPYQEPRHDRRAKRWYVDTRAANVRSRPSTRSHIIGTKYYCQPVRIIHPVRHGRWYKVKYRGDVAFMHASVISPYAPRRCHWDRDSSRRQRR